MGGGTGTGLPEGMSAAEYFRLNPPGRIRRIISPGLDKPSELERDIIYVTLSEREKKTDVVIESNAQFYYCSELQKRFEINEFPEFHIDHYDLLLEELVTFNNGVVDYFRLTKQFIEPIFKAFIRDLEAGKVKL